MNIIGVPRQFMLEGYYNYGYQNAGGDSNGREENKYQINVNANGAGTRGDEGVEIAKGFASRYASQRNGGKPVFQIEIQDWGHTNNSKGSTATGWHKRSWREWIQNGSTAYPTVRTASSSVSNGYRLQYGWPDVTAFPFGYNNNNSNTFRIGGFFTGSPTVMSTLGKYAMTRINKTHTSYIKVNLTFPIDVVNNPHGCASIPKNFVTVGAGPSGSIIKYDVLLYDFRGDIHWYGYDSYRPDMGLFGKEDITKDITESIIIPVDHIKVLHPKGEQYTEGGRTGERFVNEMWTMGRIPYDTLTVHNIITTITDSDNNIYTTNSSKTNFRTTSYYEDEQFGFSNITFPVAYPKVVSNMIVGTTTVARGYVPQGMGSYVATASGNGGYGGTTWQAYSPIPIDVGAGRVGYIYQVHETDRCGYFFTDPEEGYGISTEIPKTLTNVTYRCKDRRCIDLARFRQGRTMQNAKTHTNSEVLYTAKTGSKKALKGTCDLRKNIEFKTTVTLPYGTPAGYGYAFNNGPRIKYKSSPYGGELSSFAENTLTNQYGHITFSTFKMAGNMFIGASTHANFNTFFGDDLETNINHPYQVSNNGGAWFHERIIPDPELLYHTYTLDLALTANANKSKL
jgi:hypothetical protein